MDEVTRGTLLNNPRKPHCFLAFPFAASFPQVSAWVTLGIILANTRQQQSKLQDKDINLDIKTEKLNLEVPRSLDLVSSETGESSKLLGTP